MGGNGLTDAPSNAGLWVVCPKAAHARTIPALKTAYRTANLHANYFFLLTISVPGDFESTCRSDDANPAFSNIFVYSANV